MNEIATRQTGSVAPSCPPPTPAVRFGLGAACVGLTGYIMFHSIPGTGAVRSLFLLLLIAGLAAYSWLARPSLKWPAFDMAGKLLLLLTAWLALQSGFLAVDGPGTLKTFAGEWSKNLLIAAIGIWLARAALFARKEEWVLLATFCGFFAHVLGTLDYQAWFLLDSGKIDPYQSLFGNYGYVAPFVDGTMAIMLADAAERICCGRRLLPFTNGVLFAVLAMSLLALAVLSAKASWLIIPVLLLPFAIIAAQRGGPHGRRIVVMTVAVLVCLGTAVAVLRDRPNPTIGSVSQNQTIEAHGWNGALESIRYGQAIEQHKSWMGAGDPLPGHIKESFYMRAAWGTVGLQGLAEHPLGRGYGSNAFGRYLSEKYGIQGAVSSHSGWLDFALANGVPGLVLLLAFSTALCVQSWRAFVSQSGAGGLALAFLTISYIFRCLIDGHFTTSRLMGFALVSGVLWGLTRDPEAASESRSA